MVMGEMLRCLGRCDHCRKCNTPKGGVKDVRKVCQLVERCDGYAGDVKVLGEV